MKAFGLRNRIIPVLLALGAGLIGSPPFTASGQVVINELLAINRQALLPVAGDAEYSPAVVELYNTSTSPIDLGNHNGGQWSVSDSKSSPREYVFRPGTIIPARGYLLLYLDSETNLVTDPQGVHTMDNTNVRDNGDDFNLYNSSMTLVDEISFGIQLIDISLARESDGFGAWVLKSPTLGQANTLRPRIHPLVSLNLKVNEWMASPSSGDDWFEIYNPETNIVDISGIIFSDQAYMPPTNRALPQFSYLAAGEFLQLFADDLGNNNQNTNQYDHVDFRLGGSGDSIRIVAANRSTIIDLVTFGAQTSGISEGRMPDGAPAPFVKFIKATPEASNFQLITNVVINEILAHTDPPLEDAIEMYNPTTNAVDISYWWLSNSKNVPKKFRIPANTILQPNAYKVFYEYRLGPFGAGFNTSGTGDTPDFTLNSARGDEVYLHSGDAAGALTGSRVNRTIDSSGNSVSFGYYTNSLGEADFVPLSRRTFGMDTPLSVQQFRLGTGLPNAYPKLGPLVLTEIMYHPPDEIVPGVSTNDNSLDEYLEIYNAAMTNTPLYDPVPLYSGNFPGIGFTNYASGLTNTWRLRGEVDMEFPTNVVLAPGGRLLVVNFNPVTEPDQLAAFRATYSVPVNVPIFGPYRGKLSNNSGNIELQRPDPPQAPDRPDAGLVPYLLVERVKYSDKTSDGWPKSADGQGLALQRLKPENYGNDVANWTAGVPTPGRHPGLEIQQVEIQGSSMVLGFQSTAYTSYTVQYRTSLAPAAPWLELMDLPAQATTGLRYTTNSGLGSAESRFYRLVTPAEP